MQASISAPTLLLYVFVFPSPYHNSWARFLCYYLTTNNPLAITYVLTIYMHLLTYQVPDFLPAYLRTSRSYYF
jgi:hypothetical protein